ncbi:MAG: DUF3445 domain-containing protein [Verrucomicrobiae bacterium]|nr:DUF3445 domain-containing protein [Verrucomicrobiae bacterium]NNJ87512.1 DUF3445 domain-containing protein [Akkermansiaceae bacterium]
MNSGEHWQVGCDSISPNLKKLFGSGGFEWSFKMRPGDAESFFAPTAATEDLLAERQRRIHNHPDRYVAVSSAGHKLVESVWELALGWGQVVEPVDAVRDLANLSCQWEADLLILDQQTMTFAAGAVCFPSSWSLEKRIGQTIDDVHAVVPGLNPQIGKMITRYLSALRPGKTSRRENWSVTRSPELDYHPALQRQKLDQTVTMDELSLRVEHQLFTGISAGVLMGLRVEAIPIKILAQDRAVWNAVAEKIRTMPDEVADYKAMQSAVSRILEEMDAFSPLDE